MLKFKLKPEKETWVYIKHQNVTGEKYKIQVKQKC